MGSDLGRLNPDRAPRGSRSLEHLLELSMRAAYNGPRMAPQIALGSFLVLVTAVVHGLCTLLSFAVLRRMHHWFHWEHARLLRGTFVVSLLVLLLFLASLVEASIWARAYVAIGALEDLESAFYFSTVTFTTLGYGDLTLGTDWRLLSAFEAANGTVMFGWSTSLVVAFIHRIVAHRGDA